jgi:hypothetical protein
MTWAVCLRQQPMPGNTLKLIAATSPWKLGSGLLRILLPTKGKDDVDGDGPRVANAKRKQRQHTGSHQGESALGGAEEQAPPNTWTPYAANGTTT